MAAERQARRTGSVGLLACLFATGAAAQVGAADPAAPAGPVDESGRPVPQRIEIRGDMNSDTERRRRDPVARTLVGRDELDKFDDLSITDVLKRQPGVNLNDGNPRMRGLGAGYTQILINGEPAPPGFSLDNLPPSQVERIEIIKSPTAQFSAQGVAGTINIILRGGARTRQREVTARLSYTQDRPVPGFNAVWAERLGDFNVSLPVSGYRWAGGHTGNTERLTRDTNLQLQQLQVDSRDRWWGGGATFGPRVSVKLQENTTLEWQTFLQRNDYRSAADVQTTVLAGQPPLSVTDTLDNGGVWRNARTGLSLTHQWDSGARLEVRLSGQATRNRWLNTLDGRDGSGRLSLQRESRGRVDEDTRSSSGKWTLPWLDTHTLAAGWDVEDKARTELRSVFENGQSQLIGFDERPFVAEVRRLAVYAQNEWQLTPRISTYMGLRAEAITTTSSDADTALRSRSQVLTPLLHVQYQFDDKGRDQLRFSLTRSYKAPELNALMARPSINGAYPVTGPNPEISPDRIGNPALRPELATGVDVALEKYLAGGGVLSVGVFHRQIDGLIRQSLSLQSVSWSAVPRWVSQPVNLEGATSTGIELELKGRVEELWASAPLPRALSLRASFSAYTSSVRDIAGPDNRLEQQQPWSANMGFDHRLTGWPIGFGANLAFTPGYATQLSLAQRRVLKRVRQLDAYVSLAINRDVNMRLSANYLTRGETFQRNETQETAGALLYDDYTRIRPPTVTLAVSSKF